MMKKAVVLVLTMAATLVLAGGAALAEEAPRGTLDVSCIEGSSSSGGSYPNEAGKRSAQTFTAKTSGKLTSARTWVYNHPTNTGDYILEIAKVDASGAPTNEVLASTTIANHTVPDYGSIVTGNFDPSGAARVEAGKRYALIVRNATHGFYLPLRSDNPCSGSMYSSDSATGAFAQVGSTNDLLFETYVSVTKVDSVTPTSGQTGVARDTSPTATFSEAMDEATITASTVKLYQKNGKRWRPVSDVALSYDAAMRTVTLDPYPSAGMELLANKRYKVMVTTGVKDTAGNVLDQAPTKKGNQPYSWTFTTGSS